MKVNILVGWFVFFLVLAMIVGSSLPFFNRNMRKAWTWKKKENAYKPMQVVEAEENEFQEVV